MQRLIVVSVVLAFTSSCGEAPPIEQATLDQPAEQSEGAETLVADAEEEAPVVEPVPTNRDARVDVGDQAPNFQLKDQTGQERSLDDLLADGNVALLFFRSADWCPICRKQLTDMQAGLAAIEATGTQLVGVSYDAVEVLQKFADASGITFPLLSDPNSDTINAFGIHNQKGYPHPGTYLIGKNRKVLAAIFLEGYVKRHTPDELVTTIGNSVGLGSVP